MNPEPAFVVEWCRVPRGVGEYVTSHYDWRTSSVRCPYCHGEMRHYPGVVARAAEDSTGLRNSFRASRVPEDVRVLRCMGCETKWSTRMSDAEVAAAQR